MDSFILLSVLSVLFFVPVVIVSVAMQRKGNMRQKLAIEIQNAAVERQEFAIAQAEKTLELTQKQIENQQKIIYLLEQIRDKQT